MCDGGFLCSGLKSYVIIAVAAPKTMDSSMWILGREKLCIAAFPDKS